MPFSPGGVFSLVAGYFANPGTTIRTEQHNPPLEDIAAAMSLTVIRDGRAPMTGPLNMNGFPITGIAAGTAPGNVATLAQAMPIGALIDFAGSSAPAGWMLCFGQAVSRATYAALFSVIGTTYGAGDGVTTFTLPDCRGRTVAGVDAMGGSAAGRLTSSYFATAVLGAVGGAQSVALITSNLPPHTHSGTTGIENQGHSHATGETIMQGGVLSGGGANALNTNLGFPYPGVTGDRNQSHVHSFTTDNGSGSSFPVGIVQPTILMNKIIRVSYDG